MGEVRHFCGPSRIVGRSVKLWSPVGYVGLYEHDGKYNLNKLAELLFGDRRKPVEVLSVVGLEPRGILDRDDYVPQMLVADDNAVIALFAGKSIADIKNSGRSRIVRRDAYHEPLYIDKNGAIIRPETDEDREKATAVFINWMGEVVVGNHSDGVWIDTDWRNTLPISQQHPQSA